MLVLSRKVDQQIVIPELNISILVVEVRGDKVRLGISAPRNVTVHRGEIQTKIDKEAKVARANEALRSQPKRHSGSIDTSDLPAEPSS